MDKQFESNGAGGQPRLMSTGKRLATAGLLALVIQASTPAAQAAEWTVLDPQQVSCGFTATGIDNPWQRAAARPTGRANAVAVVTQPMVQLGVGTTFLAHVRHDPQARLQPLRADVLEVVCRGRKAVRVRLPARPMSVKDGPLQTAGLGPMALLMDIGPEGVLYGHVVRMQADGVARLLKAVQ